LGALPSPREIKSLVEQVKEARALQAEQGLSFRPPAKQRWISMIIFRRTEETLILRPFKSHPPKSKT